MMNYYQYGYPAYSYYRNAPNMAYAHMQGGPLAPGLRGMFFFGKCKVGWKYMLK